MAGSTFKSVDGRGVFTVNYGWYFSTYYHIARIFSQNKNPNNLQSILLWLRETNLANQDGFVCFRGAIGESSINKSGLSRIEQIFFSFSVGKLISLFKLQIKIVFTYKSMSYIP